MPIKATLSPGKMLRVVTLPVNVFAAILKEYLIISFDFRFLKPAVPQILARRAGIYGDMDWADVRTVGKGCYLRKLRAFLNMIKTGQEAIPLEHTLELTQAIIMAEKSIEILSDKALHRKLSTTGRQLVLEKYKINEIIDRYLKFYEMVLNG